MSPIDPVIPLKVREIRNLNYEHYMEEFFLDIDME
jgi:hypothetical protein